jgi:hypothetical protein
MNVTPQRFWARVSPPEPCLLAYELLVSPIPAGFEIDHTCHNRDLSCPGGSSCLHRACVNPAHLEVVTGLVNIAHGRVGVGSMGLTHCKHGHEYTPENTYTNPRGKRVCRTCHRERVARVRAERRRETHTTTFAA